MSEPYDPSKPWDEPESRHQAGGGQAQPPPDQPSQPQPPNPFAPPPDQAGQQPQSPYGQPPPNPYGQQPPSPYGQPPYGQQPQAPYSQAPPNPYSPPPQGGYPPAPPPGAFGPAQQYPGQPPAYPGAPGGYGGYGQPGLPPLPPGTELATPGKRIGTYLLEIPLAIITLITGYIIWTLIVWGRGQTPGKQVMGLRVYHLENRRAASWGQMFLRQFIGGIINGLFFSIGLIISFVFLFTDPLRRTIPDRIAGTIELNDPNKVLEPR